MARRVPSGACTGVRATLHQRKVPSGVAQPQLDRRGVAGLQLAPGGDHALVIRRVQQQAGDLFVIGCGVCRTDLPERRQQLGVLQTENLPAIAYMGIRKALQLQFKKAGMRCAQCNAKPLGGLLCRRNHIFLPPRPVTHPRLRFPAVFSVLYTNYSIIPDIPAVNLFPAPPWGGGFTDLSEKTRKILCRFNVFFLVSDLSLLQV